MGTLPGSFVLHPSPSDPEFPRRRNLAPKVSFNVRSITRTISASCGDVPRKTRRKNHTKKRNNERKILDPILFALSLFFCFFFVFFVFGIGCVYLTNIKHIFTPDDDAIIIVLIVFAGESKVQTSINKNNILLG